MEHTMPLARCAAGAGCRVERISLPAATVERLESLGMTRGTRIAVQNSKSGGVLIIKLRGARFALGRGITENIEVIVDE